MPDLTRVAVLLADRTRARILEELLGGTPLPAGALAARVGVAPSTVSGHLAKLEAGGLIAVEARGRRREARLAGAHVAEALEALGRLDDGDAAPVGLRAVNRRQGLRQARSCYDHMAGRVAVALADALIARGVLIADDGMFSVVPGGEDPVWAQLGVDPGALPDGPRPRVRACCDWTERRPHVAGALGAALLQSMLGQDWVRRRSAGRALTVTPIGAHGLAALGVPTDESAARGWSAPAMAHHERTPA